MNAPTRRPRHGGFTLIELLVVIVVLALLVALLLPAIGSAIRKAREAAVNAEINQMAQALADFKSKYGDYPPSRILLHESGDYSTWLGTGSGTTTALPATGTTTDITYQELAQRSLQALRKFWPRVVLSTSGGPPAVITASYFYDFNGNGTNDGYYILDGRECLTFFLGGIPQNTGSTIGASGFGRNPANPFQNTIASNNRSAPLFEFRNDRLLLLPEKQVGSTTWTGIPGYADANSTNTSAFYYAYFSAYGNGAYDPNDVNAVDPNNKPNYETDDSGTAIKLSFKVPFQVYTGTTASNLTSSPPPNPYTSSLTVGTVTYQTPQTFQIISPGADGLYGIGGQYTPNATTVLPEDTTDTTATDPNVRARERDNLTNFHNGRLE